MSGAGIKRVCVLAELDQRAACGDEISGQAAALIRQGSRSGRPAIDDTLPLLEMRDLLDSGKAASSWDAAHCVALTMDGQQSFDSARRRIFDKFRAAEEKLISSASNQHPG